MNWLGRSREDYKDEHLHLLDAVLESVMVFRLAAEVVVPLGLAKAGFLSGCTVVLGIVAATEERSEDAYSWVFIYAYCTTVFNFIF